MKKLLVIAAILVLPPLAFYGWFEANARSIVRERSLDNKYGNALKHALATSYLYSSLRFVGFPVSIAEMAVIRAGLSNEFAELYVKRGKSDTTAEIMKDLQNNVVGISLAKWREENNGPTRDEMLVTLGEQGLLVLSAEHVGHVEPSDLQGADYHFAADWFAASRERIDREVGAMLDRLYAAGKN